MPSFFERSSHFQPALKLNTMMIGRIISEVQVSVVSALNRQFLKEVGMKESQYSFMSKDVTKFI